MIPLVSGLLFRCLYHLFNSPFFWGKEMDKYKVYINYEMDSENNEKFLIIRQDKNEVVIPYHKLSVVISSMQSLLKDMEIDNGKD